jgi:tRNA nucleotidyltransferase (CCA-adding enzyme)
MQESKTIEKEVLKIITPDKKDKEILEETIKKLTKKIELIINKEKNPSSVELVGSTAKDTFLKNNLDIDLFLLFPTTFEKHEISNYSLKIGKKLLENTEESYAEHPYIRGFFNGYKTEIVPCYKIEKASQKLSAVDRTPLHTKYIKKHLKKTQKNEVRLLKQFLIGIDCYGAEAEIEGFSGYLCEILILKFDNFINLIKKASEWKYKETFSLSNIKNISFNTPLVFIDPVDSERNVASALSKEKFRLFINACQEYIKKPRITFFFPNEIKPWSLNKIEKYITNKKFQYVGVIFKKPDIIDENLYPQIRKAARSISRNCEKYGFIIHDSAFYVDDFNKSIYVIIKTDLDTISEKYVHIGPPLKLEKNVKDFIKKWENNSKIIKKPYKKNDRIFVEIKRDYTDIEEFLREKIKYLSLGKHLDITNLTNYKVISSDELLNSNLRKFWTKYLDKKKSWEF